MSQHYAEIAQLVREGRKIEAIKRLRDLTGIGLQEAKDEIERLSAELAGEEVAPRVPADRRHDVSPEVVALAKQGNKIGAIKLLREQTGLGLKEAKDQVDALGVGPPSGCSKSVAILVVVVVTTLAIAMLISVSGASL